MTTGDEDEEDFAQTAMSVARELTPLLWAKGLL